MSPVDKIETAHLTASNVSLMAANQLYAGCLFLFPVFPPLGVCVFLCDTPFPSHLPVQRGAHIHITKIVALLKPPYPFSTHSDPLGEQMAYCTHTQSVVLMDSLLSTQVLFPSCSDLRDHTMSDICVKERLAHWPSLGVWRVQPTGGRSYWTNQVNRVKGDKRRVKPIERKSAGNCDPEFWPVADFTSALTHHQNVCEGECFCERTHPLDCEV